MCKTVLALPIREPADPLTTETQIGRAGGDGRDSPVPATASVSIELGVDDAVAVVDAYVLGSAAESAGVELGPSLSPPEATSGREGADRQDEERVGGQAGLVVSQGELSVGGGDGEDDQMQQAEPERAGCVTTSAYDGTLVNVIPSQLTAV